MKYSFNDIVNAEIYDSVRVMFVIGKYTWFNNMVCDTLKYMCIDEENTFNESIGIGDDFGLSLDDSDNIVSTSVDFNTFMEVIGVSNINGKWFCRTDYSMLNKKQKDQLMKYIKEPSDNGILVIVSTEWMQYKDILKNKILSISKTSHLIQLSFPNRKILKTLIIQSFSEKNIEIEPASVDYFITKMSSAYDKYEEEIDNIVDIHKEKGGSPIGIKDIKEYMKGIDNFIISDFIDELVKPMVSDKTNSKKVLKIMMTLEDDIGAKQLVYQTLKVIDECIEFRILINKGYIPIGINYFYNDVINDLPDTYKDKYKNTKEWTFRKKAELASRTSLRDWEYIKIILTKAIENNRVSDDIMNEKCQKALYEICTRSVITPDRINNIIGIKNTLNSINNIDRIVFDENLLNKIETDKKLVETS